MKQQRLRSDLYRLSRLMSAAYGVATGPTGTTPEQSHIVQYLDLFNSGLGTRTYNEPDEILELRFKELVQNRPGRQGLNDPLPWSWRTGVSLDRLVSTVISFSDDHDNPICREYFPVANMVALASDIIKSSCERGRPLRLDEQYKIALSSSANHPFAAAVLLHGTYRAIGRVWDTRVHPSLRIPLQMNDSEMLSMLALARATASFDDGSRLDDPLGDTYHFWAQYSVGMAAQYAAQQKPLAAASIRALFHYGPNIMTLVRERIMGKTQAAGNHIQEDRLGLCLGERIAAYLLSEEATSPEKQQHWTFPRIAYKWTMRQIDQ
jgi:hypothetical protein